MTAASRPVTGAGHDPAVWRDRLEATDGWSVADLRALVPGRDRLLVLSAHPDDESIGAGRLLSAWRRSGGRALAVTATAGEACFDDVGVRPEGLAEARLVEWRAALAALDVEAGTAYGLPDGGLETAEDALVHAVTTTVTDLGDTDDLVLLAPHPQDPHPDHRAVGRAAAAVGARLGIPVWHFRVWMTYWSAPDVDLSGRLVTVAVDGTDDRAWDAAVRAFATQLEPQRPGWGAVVPPAMLAHHDRQLLVLPLEETP
ncbi:PIG-L family deacetylase [Microlunatus spumicola]|uniref:PIG-L family deacetylase n=1 Tax=Microlunatus spumicola TaxID=81499 RepID=A0ABP6XRL1_9ACTN